MAEADVRRELDAARELLTRAERRAQDEAARSAEADLLIEDYETVVRRLHGSAPPKRA